MTHDDRRTAYQTLWAIRVLDSQPGISLDRYLEMTKAEWFKSPEYEAFKLEQAHGTLRDLEQEIADEEEAEVRPSEVPGGRDDPEMGAEDGLLIGYDHNGGW